MVLLALYSRQLFSLHSKCLSDILTYLQAIYYILAGFDYSCHRCSYASYHAFGTRDSVLPGILTFLPKFTRLLYLPFIKIASEGGRFPFTDSPVSSIPQPPSVGATAEFLLKNPVPLKVPLRPTIRFLKSRVGR